MVDVVGGAGVSDPNKLKLFSGGGGGALNSHYLLVAVFGID